MLIYSPSASPRLQYITNFIIKEQSGIDFAFTHDRELWINSDDIKINYSKEDFEEHCIHIRPADLLFETEIKQQNPQTFRRDGEWLLFGTNYYDRRTHTFPFDIFAASFYLISRYEEYLPHEKDMYGRYAHENSVAFQNEFLQIPLINIWIRKFRNFILEKYPNAEIIGPSFSSRITYDIDIAFAYKSKGLVRNTGAVTKSLLTGKDPEISSRLKTLVTNASDPFDVYEALDKLHQQYQIKPMYFFLVAARNGVYDKNILPDKPVMKELVYKIAEDYETGLHPSWQSGDEEKLLFKEKNVLQKLTGKSITTSRQHYIRFNLPDTFRNLIDAGITDDYSMGYGSINGFRASVASSHYWFDLEKNEQTSLRLHPFCYMDANSLYEQKFSPDQAYEEVMNYYSACKEVDGTFIGIWHNHLLGKSKLYKGWKEVYFKFLSAAFWNTDDTN